MLDTEKVSDRYIAELPYLLGYEPTNSVVAIWLHADMTMAFAQRADIPDVENDVSNFVTIGDHNPRSAALILIYSDKSPSELWDFAINIGDTVEDNDITVQDILKVNGQEYSTFFVPKDELDSQETVKVDKTVLSQVQEYHKNQEIGSDRDSLMSKYLCADEVSNDLTQLIEKLNQLIDSLFDNKVKFKREYAVDKFIAAYEDWSDLSVEELGMLAIYLHDIKIRDEVLIQMNTLDKEGINRALDLASAVLAVTPKEQTTPLYTVTAVMAWINGNGALSSMLIDRALETVPDYNLATLIKMAVSSGLNPSLWREVISEI
jgi:hypothetical protein